MATRRKPTSKQALYSSISSHAKDVIVRLVELTQSKNENVALGACKVLLNKTLPDIKSVEVTQSSVMDTLISEEIEKYQPQPSTSDELHLASMTPEEKKRFAEEFIEIGEVLLGKGKYGVPVITGEQLGVQCGVSIGSNVN
jgi:hypothetical protein